MDKNVIYGALLEGFFLAITSAWPLFALIGVICIFKVTIFIFKMKKITSSGINDIDKMDGKTFEIYLQTLFNKLGYKVERTKFVGDYGGDLVTLKDGVRTVIQAKRYKKNVGIKAVQEVVAAKGYYDCTQAMVATNSYFTKPAIELAKANGVILWSRKDLMNALLSTKNQCSIPEVIKEIPPATFENKTESNESPCAICGKSVSDKVKQYCLSHSVKFKGKVYCYDHQKNLQA